MVNIIILSFTFVFLVTQNILLLNEESLILLCFITFIILTLNNLSNITTDYFKNQTNQIQNSLKSSLVQILEFLNKFVTLKDYSNNVLNKFLTLKLYYVSLINIITNFIPNYNKFILRISYKKRLLFLNKVEEQTIKFLMIVLLKKLTQIIKIKMFYKYIIKSPQFLCLEAILLRECIYLTKFKSK